MSPAHLYGLLAQAAHITLLVLLFGGTAQASTDLRLSYGVGQKPSAAMTEPVASASADFDAPLRLERELITHIDNMNRTTRELRAIVEAMPGPGISETVTIQAESFRVRWTKSMHG